MERRTRIAALAVALLALVAVLGLQAATASSLPDGPSAGTYPGNTLITVQSFGWFDKVNGEALIVDPTGAVVWRYDPPNTRVFDAEVLETGNVLVSQATQVPIASCPAEYREAGTSRETCVKNRVVELDRETKRVVWNYSWYDRFIEWHEVHDADRLPSGETAIIDMGNNRAFTVSRDGEVTWSWSAETHLGPGSTFWARYVPADAASEYRKQGAETDWTHMNDIDVLENGRVQLSIRNFDVVVVVDRSTDRITDVLGRPGAHSVMNEQHNPHRIAGGETVLIADSENNRVVEIDAETGERVWSYAGPKTRLQWPRDADRLPNGNTLIADSRNFRVLEVNATGEVVWSYSLADRRGIVYDVDRLGIPEEPAEVPTARSFESTDGPPDNVLQRTASWARFVLPAWVGAVEVAVIVASVLVGLWLAVELLVLARHRSGPG